MAMYGDWDKFRRHIGTLEQRLIARIRRITAKAARELAKDWKQGIKSKQFGLEDNAPLTIEAKGSSTPLIQHGDLLGSIKPHRIDGDIWFVGILKNAKTSDGDSLVDIANVLEHGSDGPIRPKNGKYLAIPVTYKAQRAGSPLNYPGHLIFLNNPMTPGAVFVDFEDEEVQYVLLPEVTIPPRPARQKVIDQFGPKLQKMYADGIAEEVSGKNV